LLSDRVFLMGIQQGMPRGEGNQGFARARRFVKKPANGNFEPEIEWVLAAEKEHKPL
jgi:hypothetical protein